MRPRIIDHALCNPRQGSTFLWRHGKSIARPGICMHDVGDRGKADEHRARAKELIMRICRFLCIMTSRSGNLC